VALNVRIPSSPAQQLISERWKISPRARSDLIVPEPDCNRFDQLWVVEDSDLTIRYEAEVEVRHQLLNPNAFGRFPSSERC
jgi:hypothetical protein